MGPTEIERPARDRVDSRIDSIHPLTDVRRIGCRIHITTGVDHKDFQVDSSNSPKVTVDRWSERLGAAFSIARTPRYLATTPLAQTVQF